jgi:cell division protein FtsQ
MPAVIRSSGQGRGGARRAAPAAYSPAKLNGAGAVGLDPRRALWAALALVCLVLLVTLFTGGRLRLLTLRAEEALDQRLAAVGFRVRSVVVQGDSGLSSADVLRAAGVRAGQPIIGLNLEDLRERVEQVGWIKSAKIVRLLPDTVVIAVEERPRLAVWQHGGETRVVDKDGQIIPEADPGSFSDLPLIVGDGANEAAAAILPQVVARPALLSRLEALVRVDARRWDLRLKDGGLIQLPAQREDSALIQLDQLEQKSRLLESGFDRIDLRDAEMITVRPKGALQAAAAPAAAKPVL